MCCDAAVGAAELARALHPSLLTVRLPHCADRFPLSDLNSDFVLSDDEIRQNWHRARITSAPAHMWNPTMPNLGSRHRIFISCLLFSVIPLTWSASAQAQVNAVPAPAACAGVGECLCDSSYQDCRSPILQLINRETVGIDVSFWFMVDTRYSNALIKRWQAGVPIRVILDTHADAYPGNKTLRDSLVAAGIPIRNYRGPGINHWKMMLFAGQGKVEFSAANFADGSYSPSPLTSAYTNYVDEAIYFTNDQAIVNSFMTKFDSQW